MLPSTAVSPFKASGDGPPYEALDRLRDGADDRSLTANITDFDIRIVAGEFGEDRLDKGSIENPLGFAE